MKDSDMLWEFLPKGLKDIFEVVNVENGPTTFDVWLDEKREKSDEDKYNNQIIGHGFTSYKEADGTPIDEFYLICDNPIFPKQDTKDIWGQ